MKSTAWWWHAQNWPNTNSPTPTNALEFFNDMQWVTAIRSPLLTPIAHGLTLLGYRTFLIVLLSLLFWLRWPKNSAWLLVSFMLCAVVNGFLKDLFEDPRPDPALHLDDGVGDSFGFPSGHTQIAVLLWGWLAYVAKNRILSIGFASIGIGVALSRLYLGVHDIGDVFGGALIGVAFLVSGLFIAERWESDTTKLSMTALGAAACTAILLLVWPNDHTSGTAMLLLGILVGFGLGVRLFGLPSLPIGVGSVIVSVVALLGLFLVLAIPEIGKVNEILGHTVPLVGTGVLAGAYYVMATVVGTKVIGTQAAS